MADEIQKELLQIPYLEIKTTITDNSNIVSKLVSIPHLFVKIDEEGNAQLVGGD